MSDAAAPEEEHPDLLILRALAQGPNAEVPPETLIEGYVDVASLNEIAITRALTKLGIKTQAEFKQRQVEAYTLSLLYVEAFVTGAQFQQHKQREADRQEQT